MRKKILFLLCILLLAVVFAITLVACSDGISQSQNNHQHSYGAYTYSAVYHWQQCSCGNKKNYGQHVYSEWIIDSQPTEASTGTKHRTCSICGFTEYETIDIVIPSHVHGYYSVVVAPTCSLEGYTEHICSCGDSYRDNYVASLGHDYVADNLDVCHNGGKVQYVCSRCGDCYDEYVSAIHPSLNVGETCEHCGYSVYSKLSGIVIMELNDHKLGYEYYGRTASKVDSALCSHVAKVFMTDNVTTVEEGAFSGCTNLKSAIISNNITIISTSCFKTCSNLESVAIGNRVTKIDSSAFSGCKKLSSINLPNTITRIESDAFRGCESLTSITLPYYLSYIGSFAFYSSGLTSITIPANVVGTGQDAFSWCPNLESVIIEDGLSIIWSGLFQHCKKLESVTIPYSIKKIYEYAFDECSSLTTIIYDGTISQWKAISKLNEWFPSRGSYVVDYTVYCSDGTIN